MQDYGGTSSVVACAICSENRCNDFRRELRHDRSGLSRSYPPEVNHGSEARLSGVAYEVDSDARPDPSRDRDAASNGWIRRS